MFWQSAFRLTLGLLVLIARPAFAKLYFFSMPFRAIARATMLYVTGLITHAA